MIKTAIKAGLIFFIAYTFLCFVTLIFFGGWTSNSWFKSFMWYMMKTPSYLKEMLNTESTLLHIFFNIIFWSFIVCLIVYIALFSKSRFLKNK